MEEIINEKDSLIDFIKPVKRKFNLFILDYLFNSSIFNESN